MRRLDSFLDNGFLRFAAEEPMLAWARHARPLAAVAAKDEAQAHWLRCGGTWFVGVDALPNDHAGRVADGPPLAGAAMDFIRHGLGLSLPLHRAQVSVCYPGYPRPSEEESAAAFAFRRTRDAAHVDGLLAEGPEKRRYLREPHAYVLGVTLTEHAAGAAPLTVWRGSHQVMRAMFAQAFAGHTPETWKDIDVTAAYQDARRRVFDSCERVVLASAPGEAVLVHRHLLHGVAPWEDGAAAPPEGRMIAYFRPEFAAVGDWLDRP
ncbi:hypothetical protein DK847_07710 [Aestuariivirga litoralis]|uniref:Phytanoyl-CoA dioxygenase n=1 Tax=Aestuariivirga litoralis TaxID=2650924 RepID=A0A2W2AP35_9HYPH|nr:hypothetical protein [Aestuariivirga litoralis]PZF77205.1 hypothetical protein DK847_07710 [Aestuariivirga litoralis]